MLHAWISLPRPRRLALRLLLACVSGLGAGGITGGITWAADAPTPPSAVIFAYQHFGDDPDPSSTIALDQFAAHLRELRSGDYVVLPVPEIVAALRDGKPLPDHTIGITIDDAHASVYTYAWPRLRAAGLPFTLFVSTDTVESGGSRMTWSQIRELAAGGVTIANQTASYPRMISQDRAYNIGQILRAQEQLTTMLGEAPRLFAYPYGEYTTALRDLVAGMGFIAAFGMQSGVAHAQADLYALPRFPLSDAFGTI
jgi:peptidoglycan/xylan/chitin deacetylase (PgdA/CDA1 family)